MNKKGFFVSLTALIFIIVSIAMVTVGLRYNKKVEVLTNSPRLSKVNTENRLTSPKETIQKDSPSEEYYELDEDFDTPEEIVYYVFNHPNSDFEKKYIQNFKWNTKLNGYVETVEVNGINISFVNKICESCAQDEDNGIDIYKIMNNINFVFDEYNWGDGGYNFTRGWNGDNIVCKISGLSETQNPDILLQNITFSCGYLEVT